MGGDVYDYSVQELCCTIYAEVSLEQGEAEAYVARLLGAVESDGRRMRLRHTRIYMTQNRPPGYPHNDRVFDARYRMEVEPILPEGMERDIPEEVQRAYVEEIADAVQRFWRVKIDAAVLAEFEDKLPLRGGYLSRPFEPD